MLNNFRKAAFAGFVAVSLSFVTDFPFKRHSMEIDYPEHVYTDEVINFRFRVGSGISEVKVFADQRYVGTIAPRQNNAYFTQSFRASGIKQVKFVATDHDHDTLNLQSGEIRVLARPNWVEKEENVRVIEAIPIKAYVFPPLPAEDRSEGRNQNAYAQAKGHPTQTEREEFVNSLKPEALRLARLHDVPASVVMGMAILESGYGYGRVALKANNLFGMKKWRDLSDAYQLKGQPDESHKGNVEVMETLPNGSIIYNESTRRDNWYWKFASRKECLAFFVEQLLKNGGRWTKDYSHVARNYQHNIANGMSLDKAADKFVYELADHGYCSLGGKVYKQRVSRVMNDWDLYQLDIR